MVSQGNGKETGDCNKGLLKNKRFDLITGNNHKLKVFMYITKFEKIISTVMYFQSTNAHVLTFMFIVVSINKK